MIMSRIFKISKDFYHSPSDTGELDQIDDFCSESKQMQTAIADTSILVS